MPKRRSVAVIRDINAIPYRWTAKYRKAREIAAQQSAAMHHRTEMLWPSQAGQLTSAILRTPGRAA